MSPWKILYKTIISHYLLLSGLLVTGLIQASCGVGIPWCLKDMIDTAIEGVSINHFNQLGFIVLVLSTILYLSYVLLLRIATLLIQRGVYVLRKDLYSSILKQPLSFSKSIKTGKLMHHVQQDVGIFENNISFLLRLSPFDFFSVIGIVILMFITSKYLLLLVSIFLVFSLILTIYVGRPLLPLSKALQNIGMRFNAQLQDVFNGLRTVKSFGREVDEIDRLDKINHEMADAAIKTNTVQSLIEPFSYLIEIMGVIVVVWFGSYLILHKQITPGTVIAFLMYVEILAEPCSRLVKYFECARTCHAVSQRLSDFINQLNHSKLLSFKGIKHYTKAKSITFENISFQHEATTHLALDNINFTAHTGQITAIVGRNGAGKSTLMDLIMGLQIPNEGQILIDKTPMSDFKENEWRKQIGVLSQEIYLFHDSIEKNIAYGKPGASIDEINEAATKAGLSRLLQRLPGGLQTNVGEKGRLLSGGELQKIALARLLLQNPNLIIFDEPASHLDSEALQEFITILLELAKNKIVLLIEHRPEVIIQTATQVVFMETGKIIAVGTHEELFDQHQGYRNLLN